MKAMAGHVSGAVLASLFYDHANSKGDQMGLLLGEVVSHVKDTISDSQIQNSEVETRVYIYASVPFKYDQKFYGRDGQISVEQIKNVLGGRYQDIRGWYSFRRSSSMMVSLREKTLHSNLLKTIVRTHRDNFLFLLCTVWVTEDYSTHSWDHSFYKLGPQRFLSVPMEVTNLGDTTHREYKQRSSHMVCPRQSVMKSVFQDQEQLFLNSMGKVDVEKIQSLTETVHSKLKGLAKAVCESEHRLSVLQNEVDQYREKIQQKSSEEEEKGLGRIHEVVKKKLSVDDLLCLEIVDNTPSVKSQVGHQHVKETDKIRSEEHEREPNILNSKSSKEPKMSSRTHPLPFHEMRKTSNWQDVIEKIEVDDESPACHSDGKINSTGHQTDEQRKEKNLDPFYLVSVTLDEQKRVTRSQDNVGDAVSTVLLQKGPEKRIPQYRRDSLSDNIIDHVIASPVLTQDEDQQSISHRSTVTSSATLCLDSKQRINAERSRSLRLRTNQKTDSLRSRSQEKTDPRKVGLRNPYQNKANSMTDISSDMDIGKYNT